MDKKLLKAAKELNEKLQCDPPIDLTDMELCSDGILQAAELIDPSDGVSKFTMNLITELKRNKEKETELDDVPETEAEKTPTEEETNTLVEEAVNSTILEDFQAAKKLKDLKDLVEQNPKIFGKINLEAFSGFEGPRLLKAEMKKYLPVPAEKEIEKTDKKTEKIPKTVKEPKESNKSKIYSSWKNGICDVKELHNSINQAVKDTTIRGWISDWKKGENFPVNKK